MLLFLTECLETKNPDITTRVISKYHYPDETRFQYFPQNKI
jgi:hypothetical protein